MSVGGSAGHSGLWGVNIDEGSRDDPGGRRWDVDISAATLCIETQKEKSSEGVHKSREQGKLKKRNQEAQSVVAALAMYPAGESIRQLQIASGIRHSSIRMILEEMIERGEVVTENVKRRGQNVSIYRYETASIDHGVTASFSMGTP